MNLLAFTLALVWLWVVLFSLYVLYELRRIDRWIMHQIDREIKEKGESRYTESYERDIVKWK